MTPVPTTDWLALTLPPGSSAAALLDDLLRGVVSRQRNLDQPEHIEAQALTMGHQLLATCPPDAPVVMGVVVDTAAATLTLALDPASKRTIPLPASAPPNAPATERDSGLGMGLYLMRQLLDEVAYAPQPGRNKWRLAKSLPATETSLTVPTPVIELSLPATHKYLNLLGVAIEHLLAQIPGLNQPAETSYATQLAVQEAAANIVDHAYAGQTAGRIDARLRLEPAPLRLVVELTDNASTTFDLSALPEPTFFTAEAAGGLGRSLLTGGAMLFVSTTIVNAGNYLFNLILGRWLGPAAFADLSLIVTLMLMVTLVTATFQTVSTKFAAAYAAAGVPGQLGGLRRWLGRVAWLSGGGLMLLLALGAPLWASFFHTESFWPFVILAIGLPVYFAQGVDRGILQGQTRFGLLSLSYQAEMWVRLVIAVLLVALGGAVNGAVAALTASFVGTWLVARHGVKGLPGGLLPETERRVIIAFAGPVGLALVGQILINNSDILIVKRFFSPEAAGHYAALALIGRIVFFATWSVVTVLFPVVAQRHQRGESHRHLLAASLGLVVAVSAGIIGATLLFPELIVGLLFGAEYLSIAPLLWLYGVATMLYALSNVVISYRLSLGNSGGSVLAVIGGVAQVTALWLFHDSLEQVVLVQIYLMAGLLALLLAWDMALQFKPSASATHSTR